MPTICARSTVTAIELLSSRLRQIVHLARANQIAITSHIVDPIDRRPVFVVP
jgi:hypothetical protein